MTEISRRLVLGGAALGGLMASGGVADAHEATMQPPFGPAPEPLAGKELPSFRFAMGQETVARYDGGTSKQANVSQFPVSEKIAGVYMTLDPGGLRELHWHANAAEWAYMLKGRARITIVDPEGQSQTVDFGKGDVWYFPRGYGHSIQGLGPEGCEFILVFDNGYFSEYGTFSITDWLAHTPKEVLAKNFGVPESTFANFPKKEVYISQGPVPAALPLDPPPGSVTAGPLSHRYQLLAQKPEEFPGGTISIVSQNEFPISSTITGAILTIRPGGMREMHWHPNAAEWQFYMSGRARMTVFGSAGRAKTEDFSAGDVGYVPQGFGHYIENVGDEDLEVLLALNNATYESISITEWMSAQTDLLLATNFEVPEATFEDFPTHRLVMPEGKG
ncbi:cupin domain-containing protein [Microbaculum marinum]|uniref:Cupin domain-containing protein n=1 Tax=Microbaculum marinum TaxID=1764581 RepID=A0AAW9RZI4_9HYPH